MPDEKEKIMVCEYCGRTYALLLTAKGKHMPVDAETLTDWDLASLQAGEEVEFRHPEHVSHYATCPEFKKAMEAAKTKEQAPRRVSDMSPTDFMDLFVEDPIKILTELYHELNRPRIKPRKEP